MVEISFLLILTTVYCAVDDLYEDIFMQIKCNSTGVIAHHNPQCKKWLSKVVFLLPSYFPSMLMGIVLVLSKCVFHASLSNFRLISMLLYTDNILILSLTHIGLCGSLPALLPSQGVGNKSLQMNVCFFPDAASRREKLMVSILSR